MDIVDEEVDDSICPVCRGSTYVGETISCETCHYWFHFECVGVSHTDECVLREDVPYYCPSCCKPKRKLLLGKTEAKESFTSAREYSSKAINKNLKRKKSHSSKQRETGNDLPQCKRISWHQKKTRGTFTRFIKIQSP